MGRNPPPMFSPFLENFARFSVSEMSDFIRVSGLLFAGGTAGFSDSLLGHTVAAGSDSIFSLSRSLS